MQYRIGEDEYADVPETLYVAKSAEVDFKAIRDPAGAASWPNGKPVWGGTAGVTGTGETKSITLNTAGAFTVTAECGNTVTANIRAVWCTIDNVARTQGQNLPSSVPPGRTRDVTATITPTLGDGHYVQFDVINNSADNGTATTNTQLTATGTVTVSGGDQTVVGHAGQLEIRARLDGTQACGESAGFSVCAHATDWTDARDSDINNATVVGLVVQDGWSSDGTGTIAQLDQLQISEVVGEHSRDNPPFTAGIGNTSGYLPGDTLTKDTHTYTKASINLTGLAAVTEANSYKFIADQLSIQKCDRCGATDFVVLNSGLQRIHHAWKEGDQWKHKTTKVGAGVTVGGYTSAAGSANATSDAHNIP